MKGRIWRGEWSIFGEGGDWRESGKKRARRSEENGEQTDRLRLSHSLLVCNVFPSLLIVSFPPPCDFRELLDCGNNFTFNHLHSWGDRRRWYLDLSRSQSHFWLGLANEENALLISHCLSSVGSPRECSECYFSVLHALIHFVYWVNMEYTSATVSLSVYDTY